MNPTNRLSVLYADDNEDSRIMLSMLLGFSDIDVSFARTVEEAYQTAQNREFDLYLLDSRFSDGSGLELCQQLRSFKPHTPIVFYSGDAYETDKEQGLMAGADAYLIKPNDFERLEQTVISLINKVPSEQPQEALNETGFSFAESMNYIN